MISPQSFSNFMRENNFHQDCFIYLYISFETVIRFFLITEEENLISFRYQTFEIQNNSPYYRLNVFISQRRPEHSIGG